jgi:hypothetical protein
MRGRGAVEEPRCVDIAEEPTALIGHGGVSEGAGPIKLIGPALLGSH